jgi:hypothetical protein
MRRFLWPHLLLLFAVLLAGCLQTAAPPAPAAPPADAPPAIVTLPPAATTAAPVHKQLNITAEERKTEVIVRYNGGPDAADLVSLNIRINNQNSQNVQRTITDPVIGAEYIFTYRGVADASVVNVVGTFRDGTEQTVLMAYV